MTHLVLSCMKDEAVFLMEWLAWHLCTGFDRALIYTNDCSDGTDALLDRLAEIDERILHRRNDVPEGQPPQVTGMRAAFDSPELAAADWVFHCDADEYLHVTCGAGQVADLIEATAPADCIAIAWRPFGNAGVERWEGGLVTDAFTRTDPNVRGESIMHKCLFRPDRFGRAIDHMPKDPVAEDVILKNTAGEEVYSFSLFHPRRARHRGMTDPQKTWENARLHHYAIRSTGTFLMKNLRGDGMALETQKYHINSTWWRRNNRNAAEDASMRDRLDPVRLQIAHWRADAEVTRIEAAAVERFRTLEERVLEPSMRAALTVSEA